MSSKSTQPLPQGMQTAQEALNPSLPPKIDYASSEISSIPELPSELANDVSFLCSYFESLNKKENKDESVRQSDRSS